MHETGCWGCFWCIDGTMGGVVGTNTWSRGVFYFVRLRKEGEGGGVGLHEASSHIIVSSSIFVRKFIARQKCVSQETLFFCGSGIFSMSRRQGNYFPWKNSFHAIRNFFYT